MKIQPGKVMRIRHKKKIEDLGSARTLVGVRLAAPGPLMPRSTAWEQLWSQQRSWSRTTHQTSPPLRPLLALCRSASPSLCLGAPWEDDGQFLQKGHNGQDADDLWVRGQHRWSFHSCGRSFSGLPWAEEKESEVGPGR